MHTKLSSTPPSTSFLKRYCKRMYVDQYRRLMAIALLAFGAFVLLIAYIGICIHTGSVWPWGLVVHEDGQRTLLGTVFYFEHATRELPLDVLLGVAIGGSLLFAFPPAQAGVVGEIPVRLIMGLAIATSFIIAFTLIGTALRGGLSQVLDNLLQYHTRPGWPLMWGGHWRYHLGSRLALVLVSIGLAGILRTFGDLGRIHNGQAGLIIVALILGIYAMLTILFAEGQSSILWALSHPISLGHQARELLTHTLVTLPLAWGVCLLVVPMTNRVASSRSIYKSTSANFGRWAMIAGAVGIILAAYIGIAAIVTGASTQGQSDDLAVLLFPHFFEHSITYLITPLVAALVYVTVAWRNQ